MLETELPSKKKKKPLKFRSMLKPPIKITVSSVLSLIFLNWVHQKLDTRKGYHSKDFWVQDYRWLQLSHKHNELLNIIILWRIRPKFLWYVSKFCRRDQEHYYTWMMAMMVTPILELNQKIKF